MAHLRARALARAVALAVIVSLFCGARPPVLAGQGEAALTPQSVVELAAKKDAVSHGGFNWIPGSYNLVYSQVRNVQDGSWIYELQATTGNVHKLLQGQEPVPSPDGKSLAYLRSNGTGGPNAMVGYSGLQLWVADRDGSNPQMLTTLKHGTCEYAHFAWSPDSKHIAYMTCEVYGSLPTPAPSSSGVTAVASYPIKGDEGQRWIVHVIGVSDRADKVVVEHDGQFQETLAWLDAKTILFGQDNGASRDNARSALLSVSIATGKTSTMLAGYYWWPLYYPVVNPARSVIAFRCDPHESSWYPWGAEIGLLHLGTHRIQLLRFTKNAVQRSDEFMSWSPNGKWLLYSNGSSTRRQLIATDGTAYGAVTSGDGTNRNAVFSSDGRYVAWLHNNGKGRSVLRLGEWRAGRILRGRDLATLTNPLSGMNAGASMPVRWKSFDGLAVDGYLTVPVHGKRPFKTVVFVHGGPDQLVTTDTQEWPGEIYFVQLLAQLGYAVFQPDYRESQNFGHDVTLAGYAKGDYIKESYEDLATGVASLVEQGWADRAHLYLLGHSNGSYLVDWILTHDRRFRAAVSYEGWDNLTDWSGTNGPSSANAWMMGKTTPLTRPDLWISSSAVMNASYATTPTLFVNAENGINSQSLPWLAGALRSKGIDSQYVLYRAEPHILERPENQVDFVKRILRWLREH